MQVDLNLCWTHMSVSTFSDVETLINFNMFGHFFLISGNFRETDIQ